MTVPHWFSNACVGLFIHWDHASIRGVEIGWPMVGGLPHLPSPIPETADEYRETAAEFDPKAWDPQTLVAAAQRIRARYVVFTTRHHAGWATWPTRTDGDSIATSPFGERGGDLVRDIVDAFREAGIRIGLYYSLSDWSHPDYPAWTDDQRPYRNEVRRGTPEQWARYRDYVKAQLSELLTDYGQIDLLWFDGDWERTPEEWQSDDIVAHIRTLMPDVVINDRLPGQGDYATPEQHLPVVRPEGPWECGVTINHNWGYVPTDTGYKSAFSLLRTMVQVRSQGGNLLLDVGPTGDGELDPIDADRIAEIGAWLDAHGDTVIDIDGALEPWQYMGPTTRSGDRVFLHLLGVPRESVLLRGIPVRRVRSARFVDTGAELDFEYEISPLARDLEDPYGDISIAVPEVASDALIPVIEVVIEGFGADPAPREQFDRPKTGL